MPRAKQLRTMLSPEAMAIEQLLQVKDKLTGKIVPFKLNPVQRRYDMQWTGRDRYNQPAPTRDIINKARQQGVSAIITAYILIMALWKPYFRAIILTHVSSSSEVLLDKIKFYLANPQRELGKFSVEEEKTLIDNRKIIKLANGSSIIITTANNKNTAVGDTADAIHASEVAKWRKSTIDGLKTGLLQTLPPTGHLWYESTGEGLDGFFYDITMNAYRDTRGDTPHWQNFFSWVESKEYSKIFASEEDKRQFMENLRDDLEELQAIKRCKDYGLGELTPEQLYWRRDKILSDFIKNGAPNLKLFKQEYPSTLLESFQSTAYTIFPKYNWIEDDDNWIYDDDGGYSYLKGHPKAGHMYVAGVDVGAGIGKNSTVLTIWDVDDLEEVFQHVTNLMSPIAAAYLHARFMWRYRALCIPELNNHGYAYISHLIEVYPQEFVFSEDRTSKLTQDVDNLGIEGFGFLTGVRKPLWINRYADFLSTSGFVIYSRVTASQLNSFTETDSGKMEGDNDADDDAVMSGLMCFVGVVHLDKVPVKIISEFGTQEVKGEDEPKGEILKLIDAFHEENDDLISQTFLEGDEEWTETWN